MYNSNKMNLYPPGGILIVYQTFPVIGPKKSTDGFSQMNADFVAGKS
jgi:hypothetical protein